VDGCGIDKLKEHGIYVESGILEDECEAINPGFHKFHSTKLPYVHLKVAIGFDGKVGTGKWFTGEKAREAVHRFRANSDLIITGSGTIKKDNPKFSAIINGVKHNTRVAVLDTALSLKKPKTSGKLNIIKDGNELILLGRKDGCRNLPRLIKNLAGKYHEIFIEAGPAVTTAFLSSASEYVDRITVFVAPVVFPNKARSFFENPVSRFPALRLEKLTMLDNTVMADYSVIRKKSPSK
jgi:diaminohydroxyphosphoribosylaminopyrimidine deaminase / 5-amino-6-(5-phosphoribosylamino)uracil reductase